MFAHAVAINGLTQLKKDKKMEKQIKLLKETMCAYDQHEITHYPRHWYKPKPMLPKGTVLKVKKEWTNFYGSYYRCTTPDGDYDIPVENAEEVVPKVGELEENCASPVCAYRGNGVCSFKKDEFCPMFVPKTQGEGGES